MLAQQIQQLIADNLHHLLVGRKLQHHFAAERLLADVGQQFVGHADVHVAFQQRFANFSERDVQVLFAELALPAQVLECSLQSICQVLKHDLYCPLYTSLLYRLVSRRARGAYFRSSKSRITHVAGAYP